MQWLDILSTGRRTEDRKMMRDLDTNRFYNAFSKRDLFDEYLAFSLFFQHLFISDGGYIIDTGNFRSVNNKMIELVEKRVKKHPILWKLFMIA